MIHSRTLFLLLRVASSPYLFSKIRLTMRKTRPCKRDRGKDPVTRKHARPVKGERERAERERKSTHRCCWVGDLPQNERSRDGYPGREKCGPKPHTTRSPAHTLRTPHRYRRASWMTNMQHHPKETKLRPFGLIG